MKNWKNQSVLVTGGEGFIGSHLVTNLVALGSNVTALSMYNSFDHCGWLDDLPDKIRQSINIVRGDVRDSRQMDEICKGQNIVFHLAALISIPFSYEAPSSYVETNIQGTINVLNGALNGGATKFIHTSTSEVYGTAQTIPISEDHPLQGQSPYSASKIGSDMMVESFYRSFELPTIILRPFNTFGPRQSERAVLSTIIRQMLDDECVEIRLGDTTPKRDFNFVENTVQAFLAIAELDDKYNGNAYNAGSGQMYSIAEAIEIIQKIVGTDKPVTQESVRNRPEKSEVMTLIADSTKLKEHSNWQPKINFETGLQQTIEWWRERIHTARPGADYIY
jgi:NAD dependent epimerase/dehydratase